MSKTEGRIPSVLLPTAVKTKTHQSRYNKSHTKETSSGLHQHWWQVNCRKRFTRVPHPGGTSAGCPSEKLDPMRKWSTRPQGGLPLGTLATEASHRLNDAGPLWWSCPGVPPSPNHCIYFLRLDLSPTARPALRGDRLCSAHFLGWVHHRTSPCGTGAAPALHPNSSLTLQLYPTSTSLHCCCTPPLPHSQVWALNCQCHFLSPAP